MNPFEDVKAHSVAVRGDTALIAIDLRLYPQVATKEAIDAGMAYYVQKHAPNIRHWEARSDGNILTLIVTGRIDVTTVLRMA